MTDLFQFGTFTAHSGDDLFGKIECDKEALSDGSIQTAAYIFGNSFTFSEVYGIPSGGDRFAEALRPYCKDLGPLAIVDDVLTTSRSMEEVRKKFDERCTIGLVIFSRGICPSWIFPFLELSEWAQTASYKLANSESRR